MTTNTSGKFGPKEINPGTGRLTQHAGKGDALLPSRKAMNKLKNPVNQTLMNYSKLTPSGANAPVSYQDIIDMSRMGAREDQG